MKKILSMACVLGALLLTSCGEDTLGASTYDVREGLYNRTFVEKFGAIGADQNWDFYAQAVANNEISASSAKRFFCEDIGDVGDFDFNDLVFDIEKTKEGYDLVVRAVGGTLPIKLRVGDTTTEELHGLFDIKTTATVNAGGARKNPLRIHLKQDISDLASFTDVHVQVNYPEGDVATFSMSRNGEVPKIFAVPASTLWMRESTGIKSGYNGFFSTKDWYRNPTNTNKLFS